MDRADALAGDVARHEAEVTEYMRNGEDGTAGRQFAPIVTGQGFPPAQNTGNRARAFCGGSAWFAMVSDDGPASDPWDEG